MTSFAQALNRSMATSMATVTCSGASLLETVKRLLSRITVEVLNSMSKSGINMTDKRNDPKVFCSQDCQHGDLLIRKEYLISVLTNRQDEKYFKVEPGLLNVFC